MTTLGLETKSSFTWDAHYEGWLCSKCDHYMIGNNKPSECSWCKEAQEELYTALYTSEMPKRYRAFDSFKLWEKPHLPIEYIEGKITAILVAREMVRRPLTEFTLASLNERFADDTRLCHSLMLIGANGFGKTTLLATILNLIVAQGIGAKVITPRGLWLRLKATFDNKTGEREADIIQELIDAPLLGIDEFNAPPSDSDYFINAFEHIVRSRYNSETPKPFVITTNSEEYDLEKWRRQSLAVLFEMCHRVRMGGLPFRDEGKAPAKESF